MLRIICIEILCVCVEWSGVGRGSGGGGSTVNAHRSACRSHGPAKGGHLDAALSRLESRDMHVPRTVCEVRVVVYPCVEKPELL